MANQHKDNLLKSLAVEMIYNPRGTTKALAEAVGISKATLHRFCGTRENLEHMLNKRAFEAFDKILAAAQEECDDCNKKFRNIIDVHCENFEFVYYIFSAKPLETEDMWNDYLKVINSFFLEGQKKGIFRVEFSVSFLAEVFVSSICGIVDAGHRGRVATVGMAELFEDFFLKGALNQDRIDERV